MMSVRCAAVGCMVLLSRLRADSQELKHMDHNNTPHLQAGQQQPHGCHGI